MNRFFSFSSCEPPKSLLFRQKAENPYIPYNPYPSKDLRKPISHPVSGCGRATHTRFRTPAMTAAPTRIVIDGFSYDVSDFKSRHPGGSGERVPCTAHGEGGRGKNAAPSQPRLCSCVVLRQHGCLRRLRGLPLPLRAGALRVEAGLCAATRASGAELSLFSPLLTRSSRLASGSPAYRAAP